MAVPVLRLEVSDTKLRPLALVLNTCTELSRLSHPPAARATALSRERERAALRAETHRGHASTTALYHCAVASARKMRSVDREEVALQIEGVVNGGVHAEKALGGSNRLEPLQLALASAHHLMRVLRPIVHSEPLVVGAGQPQSPERRGVGSAAGR